MQSIRFVVRQIGIPSVPLDIISAQDTGEYLEYQYTSQGYDLKSEHFLGEVRDALGSLQGYRFGLWFVKNEEVKAKKA